MNYLKIYSELVEKARNRNKKETGWERHHIIPRCLGGSFKKDNIVVLKPREHYIAHYLLCRIYPENAKLSCALWFMSQLNTGGTVTRKYKVTSRAYEHARLLFCNHHTGRKHNADALVKMQGRKCTDEQNLANSLLQKKLIKQDEISGIKRSARLKSWLPFWTDGVVEKRSENSPGDAWSRGRITKGKKWWNNGSICKMQVTSPSLEWTEGRLYRRKDDNR